MLALCAATGLSTTPALCLGNGYPPPPGPFPFASVDDAPAAAWSRPQGNGSSALPYSGSTPGNGSYPAAVRDPYSADTLFGAAPAIPDAPTSDVPAMLPGEPDYAYPAMPHVTGPAAGRPAQKADFSMDFKRERRQQYEPAYGYPTTVPQWHYPAGAAGDVPMAMPYPTESAPGYGTSRGGTGYGGGYPDTAAPFADAAAFAPASSVDLGNGDAQKRAAIPVAARPQAPKPATPDQAPRAHPTQPAAAIRPSTVPGGDRFRPAQEGE